MSKRYLCVDLHIFVAFVLAPIIVCQDTANEKLSTAANCFTLNMYKQLGKSQNSFVSSPFSLDVLLSILRVGAGGNTQQELTNALGYGDLSVPDMEKAFKSKMEKLTGSDGNTLEVANSVWIQNGFSVKQSFKDVVTNDFYAQVETVDFNGDSKDATGKINSWGNTKTHGLIPVLFDDDLDSDTVMVLVNALYFKGEWATKFESKETKDGSFYNKDSQSTPSIVKLMHSLSSFKYYLDNSLKAQVLEMDYKGGKMSMQIFLPQEGSNIENLESALTCENFEAAANSGWTTNVDVTVPKFEITSTFSLNEPIMDLGMKDIFKDSANFSGIAPNITVSEVIQKAMIKVNEEGSEAAALTGIPVGRTAPLAPQEPQIEYFRANHPFIFTIRNKLTNIVLFMGRVNELPNA